jgi:hypothetical protein
VAYRHITSEVEHNLHFWRRVIHPLDAGGMFTIQRGDCVDVSDPAKRIFYTVTAAWREPRDANPCKNFYFRRNSCLKLLHKTRLPYFIAFTKITLVHMFLIWKVLHFSLLDKFLYGRFNSLLGGEIMWTTGQAVTFYKNRLKYWQARKYGS